MQFRAIVVDPSLIPSVTGAIDIHVTVSPSLDQSFFSHLFVYNLLVHPLSLSLSSCFVCFLLSDTCSFCMTMAFEKLFIPFFITVINSSSVVGRNNEVHLLQVLSLPSFSTIVQSVICNPTVL